MEPEEYEEAKNETVEQLKEFKESLDKMLEGNLSLVDDLNSMQLVNIQFSIFYLLNRFNICIIKKKYIVIYYEDDRSPVKACNP